MFGRTNLRTGMQVYSSDNHQIGTIGEVGQSHIKCETGILGLGRDLYIPSSAVTRVEDNRCYLGVVKDQVGQRGNAVRLPLPLWGRGSGG